MTLFLKGLLKAVLLAAALFLPPLLGLLLAGQPLERYLDLPPRPQYVWHAPFSWTAFATVATLVLAAAGPLLWRGLARTRPAQALQPARRAFPWWGWLGVAMIAVGWLLAWTRYDWFTPLQHHTFTPPWLGFILVINAAAWQRTGHCMLTHRPGFFLALFPASSLFWWYFEYLNRFVQNWQYLGMESFLPLEYVLFSSLAFSTVLPAVLGTVQWLQSFARLGLGFTGMWKLPGRGLRPLGLMVLIFTALAGAGMSLWPDHLFAMVWLAPLGAILGTQWLFAEKTVLDPLHTGDWRPVALPALAALLCGLLWEFWNAHSLAHWEYRIPLVDRFRIFEMPLLGYAGYLPFGVVCLAAVSLLPGGRWIFPGPEETPSPH